MVMSERSATLPAAQVIDLGVERFRRRGTDRPANERVLRAISRIEPLIPEVITRPMPYLEREIVEIERSLAQGQMDEAATRLERLADLLEHPALGGTRRLVAANGSGGGTGGRPSSHP